MSDLNKLDNLKAAAREGKWPTVWTEKKALALLAKLSTPDTIIELFERLEAAEARAKELEADNARLRQVRADLSREANAFEAELARRDKEAGEPVAYTSDSFMGELKASRCVRAWLRDDANDPGMQVKLYTAAQPAALPPEMTPKHASRIYGGEIRGFHDGYNQAIADAKSLGVKPLRVKFYGLHPYSVKGISGILISRSEAIEALKSQGIELEE